MNTSVTHILVVSSYFYPKIGGMENYAYQLAKKLHQSGAYRMTIITSNYDSGGYKCEEISGMTVHRLPIWFKFSNTPINPLWFWRVKQIIAREKPDIVHLHSPVPYLPDVAALASKNIPLVLTYHAGSMQKGAWPIDLIVRLYEKVFLYNLFAKAHAVITISQEFAHKEFPKFTYKMHFIPTGVDLSRFTQTPLPQDKETITFVGRVELTSVWKGIDQLLEAFVLVRAQHPHAILEIVGGGDALDMYRARAVELHIDDAVFFLDSQVGRNLVEAYKRSSVVVLPSTSDAEAFSVVLVEAMASGRPIIGTDIGGTPQVITEGKNGLLVPPKDPVRLAGAIVQVLEDRGLASDLAEGGAEMAQYFSWDFQARKYSNLFTSLLSHYEK